MKYVLRVIPYLFALLLLPVGVALASPQQPQPSFIESHFVILLAMRISGTRNAETI